MNGPQKAVLLLIVIAGLFIAVVVYGVADKKDSQSSPGEQEQRNYKPEGWAKGLGSVLSPFATKIDWRKETSLGKDGPLRLEAKQSVQIEFKPSAESKYRKATFAFPGGKIDPAVPLVTFEYDPNDVSEGDYSEKLAETMTEDSTWPEAGDNGADRMTLMILNTGGRLTILANDALTRAVLINLE
jgi:hypothetical protein